ncbi:hypothetical protein ACFRAE_11005 [Sphingobacterium sp. HJSM2_6]|uniref:hypothetical protein n=1 Tax=Sphingobacterium sp. HJSM2_6 TaxID=3366264 RepID=UPI003BC57220
MEIEKLVYSLSSSEIKQFLKHGNLSNDPKYYQIVFNAILASKGKESKCWQDDFKRNYPSVSLDSALKYLYKVLTEILVRMRIEENAWYQQLQGLMRAQLCFERSLPVKGIKETQEVYRLAIESENLVSQYLSKRMELNFVQNYFQESLNEQSLIDFQLETKNTLKALHEKHDSFSLFELLNVRLMQNPQISVNNDDLILAELNLTFKNLRNNFETKKKHLLFQSFYFVLKQDYSSALLIFEELTRHFESFPSLWDVPPYDYLMNINGILNSLRSMQRYEEMGAYIQKIQQLLANRNTAHFNNLAHLLAYTFELNALIGLGKREESTVFIKTNNLDQDLFFVDMEMTLESQYFQALSSFLNFEYTGAKRILNNLFKSIKKGMNYEVYRAARLLYILSIYEVHDADYVDFEIKSYKRLYQKSYQKYRLEKFVFKLINMNPKRRGNDWKKTQYPILSALLADIMQSNKETNLSKYFNYSDWLSNMFK